MGDDLGKIKYGGVEWTAKSPNEIWFNGKLIGFWDWDYNEDKFKIYFEDYDPTCRKNYDSSLGLGEKLHTGSSIAKSGFNEEKDICENLNNNKYGLKDKIESEFGFQCNNDGTVLKGNSKTDIRNVFNFQVKKYTKKGFGQLDRHYVNHFIESISELERIKSMLVGLCELPLCDDGRRCDRTKKVKKLCNSVYSDDQLSLFIKTLNENKRKILNYVFLGNEKINIPEFIIGVKYIQNKRKNITIYKISEIIDILMKEDFKIRKSKTVFELGNSLTFQRKGGDKGKKGANHIQCKFSFGKFHDLYGKNIYNKVIINL